MNIEYNETLVRTAATAGNSYQIKSLEIQSPENNGERERVTEERRGERMMEIREEEKTGDRMMEREREREEGQDTGLDSSHAVNIPCDPRGETEAQVVWNVSHQPGLMRQR